MEVKVEAGMKAVGHFVCRSGSCPDCGTLFDDGTKDHGLRGLWRRLRRIPRGMPPVDEMRYCPKCKKHKLGKIKSEGEIKG